MKKLFKALALCAMVLTTLSSCEKIEGMFGKGEEPSNSTYEPSDLTPTEHQAKLEQIAIEVLDQINPADVEELAMSLITLGERIPEDIYGDEGEWEEDIYDEYTRSIKNLDANKILALTTRASEEFIIDINDPEFGFGGYCIELTEDGEIIESEGDPKAIVVKWDNSVLTLTWGENKGEYRLDEKEEDILYIVKVPKYFKVVITIDGKEHFSTYIEPNITDNYTYAPAVTVKLNGGYELYGKTSANNKGLSAEASFKKNGKKILGGAAAFAINGFTNPENWYDEYYDEYWEETVTYFDPYDYFIENVSNSMVQYDILTLSIIANGDLKTMYEKIEELDNADIESEKEFFDKGCAIMNEYLEIVAVYNDTKEKIADIEMQTGMYEDYDEYYDEYYEYYSVEPVLVFPDGSKYAFEDYFTESGFGNLIERIGEMMEDME